MINLDTIKPYTFKQYKDYYRDLNNPNEIIEEYNSYLVDWKKFKTQKQVTDNNYTFEIYKDFLKNINLDNLSTDIQNFINQLDYDDPYEVDLAVHYFSESITREFNRLKDYREELRFNVPKNNLKSSKLGIEKYLKAHLLRLVLQPDFYANIGTKKVKINKSKLSSRLKIFFNRYATKSPNLIDSDLAPYYDNKVDLKKSVKELSKNTIQALQINSKNKKYLQTSKKVKLVINKTYTDWEKLPERYFAGENKKLENLNINLFSGLKEKYLSTDLFLLSGTNENYTLNKIFEADKPFSNLYRYYNPVVAKDYGTKIREDLLPFQLSYNNAGLAIALSKNLTYNVNLSALSGEFVVPDPSRIQSGIGLGISSVKRSVPINYNADNSWIKNNENVSINVNDNSALKGTGYQSKENSLQYTPNGINKVTDEISFWEGDGQIVWKNKDVYERYSLNLYPETERFNDLLILNSTNTQVRSDVYGNEFILLKDTRPKRKASSQSSSSSSGSSNETCESYDALYFDGLLSAISAADPTTFTSLTSIYDTVLFNDNSGCEATFDSTAVSISSFFAPLSTSSCDVISGDDLVDGGPFANHPCRSNEFIGNEFSKFNIPYYNNTAVSPYNTVYISNATDEPSTSAVPLYNENYTTPGKVYIRDITSQKVYTLYERMSGVFAKLPTAAQSGISADEILNMDIIGNTIFIQLSSSTFTEKYNYDETGFTIAAPSISIINK
jgi:hypothetical protein